MSDLSESLLKKYPMDRVASKLQESLSPVNQDISLLKEALKQVSEAFLLIDLQGVLALANDAAFKLFSLPTDSTLGESFWKLFPDDYFGFSMRESLKFGLPHRLIYKSHRLLELEISASFILLGPPEHHGLTVVARDLSERKRLQAMIQRIDRMKELGEMATQIAHEIRNPLGGIRGFASLLVRDLEGAAHLQEMAKSIIEGTKTLEKLVAGILHYARPIFIQLLSKDIGTLLKEVAKFVKVDPAFPSSIKIEIHIPNDPILVPIDPDLIKSALLNLTLNAIQAMPHGGLLTLSLLKLEGCCQIAIADTGIGMDPEILKTLFSPCFTTKKRGNGLGLVETEKIVKAHKGSIDVRSQPSKGSTFTITLPLKR